ncbi:MAG TPA: hypothetical protein VJ955_02225 [Desulfuromonadales bacterium]|nr:hypothetical protein [Desulfuromonadales bacterium]
MVKKVVLTLMCCLFATGAYAATSPFQMSLTPDIAIQPKTTQINGVTLNIWGENPQRAFALGFVNGSNGYSSGVSLGLLANYAENYKGAQLAFLTNFASERVTGLQWAAFNYAQELNGLQLGLINYAETSQKGLQVGLINIMRQTTTWFRHFPNEVAPAMVFVNWRF